MLEYPFTDYALVCQVVLENPGKFAFLKDVSVFSLHSKYLPLENGMVSQLNKIYLTQVCFLLSSWVEISHWY